MDVKCVRRTVRVVLLLGILLLAMSGCGNDKQQAKKAPVVVSIYQVVPQTVPLTLSYIGVSQAVSTVDLRARVEGFLSKRNFKEGAFIKAGDILYVIDKRQYEADLAQAKAQLAEAKAKELYSQQEIDRMAKLVKQGAISQEKYDQNAAQINVARAQVSQEAAAVAQAELNLSYCTIYAPISGKIGETLVDVGNLVGGSTDTKLATIIQLDPIYVVFNPSSEDYAFMLKYMKKQNLLVTATMPDQPGESFTGELDFVNNQVEQQTATIMLRATMKNPGFQLLPGLYMQVNVHVTELDNTIIVPSKAIVADQGNNYVYLVNANKTIQRRAVQLSRVIGDQTVVTKGLQANDQVVTDNVQRIHKGDTVKVQHKKTMGK